MNEKLRGLLREARELMERGDFRDGYCMCGSAVDTHTLGDGHSPCDAGEYYASQVIERIDDTLSPPTGLQPTGCPTPRRNRLGDMECPSCGRSWDPCDGAPVCTGDRRSRNQEIAARELEKIRRILGQKNPSTVA